MKAITGPRSAAAASALLLCFGSPAAAATAQSVAADAHAGIPLAEAAAVASERTGAISLARAVLAEDVAAMRAFRPAYPFWTNIFNVPDGAIVFGSADGGQLLATLPARGDWTREGSFADPRLAAIVQGQAPNGTLTERRDRVAALLAAEAGPVVHNATRGNFLLPNVRRYGAFVSEWAAIFERFAVPAEIGLAQAILESGLNGRVRSEARALGFCQWLPQNWERLQRHAHHVIEGYNQTTQAPYCAAYLTILATKYGSFIPALSEHHAGGTNVGRVAITGERLGGQSARERYLLGSRLVRDLREIAPGAYRDVYGTYGPRSFLYAEMVFGNTLTVEQILATVPQQRVYAMRAPRAIAIADIARRTGLSNDEIRRFNPALVQRVPAGANLYLPSYVSDFGPDVTFWHRPASDAYLAVLDDFLRLDATLDEWNDPAFRAVLGTFQRRFAATGTEEGRVMATVLAYAMDEMYTGGRPRILAEYTASERVRRLQRLGASEQRVLELTPSVVRPVRETTVLRGAL